MAAWIILAAAASVSDADSSFSTPIFNVTAFRAIENAVPYVVSIEKTRLEDNEYANNQCTGMILSRQWVSTSCVCLREVNSKDGLFTWPPPILYRLTTGVTNRSSPEREVRFAMKIFYHPQCDVNLNIMDVAVIMANYPFRTTDFLSGRLSPFPLASKSSRFVGAGLDVFIRRPLVCAVYGWPTIPGQNVDNLLELNVVLEKEAGCWKIVCAFIPSLCHLRKAQENTKGLGFVCAHPNDSLHPCTGFQGGPLVCGTNVWATVTTVTPCNETGAVILTRLDVQHDFLKTKMSAADRRNPFTLVVVVITSCSYVFLVNIRFVIDS